MGCSVKGKISSTFNLADLPETVIVVAREILLDVQSELVVRTRVDVTSEPTGVTLT